MRNGAQGAAGKKGPVPFPRARAAYLTDSGRDPRQRSLVQSMNFVGSTYDTGRMIANGYFGSHTVLPNSVPRFAC